MTQIISLRKKKSFALTFKSASDAPLPPLRMHRRAWAPGTLHSVLGSILVALFMTAMAQSFVHVGSNGEWAIEFRQMPHSV